MEMYIHGNGLLQDFLFSNGNGPTNLSPPNNTSANHKKLMILTRRVHSDPPEGGA